MSDAKKESNNSVLFSKVQAEKVIPEDEDKPDVVVEDCYGSALQSSQTFFLPPGIIEAATGLKDPKLVEKPHQINVNKPIPLNQRGDTTYESFAPEDREQSKVGLTDDVGRKTCTIL